jgi:hypothetical protein
VGLSRQAGRQKRPSWAGGSSVDLRFFSR